MRNRFTEVQKLLYGCPDFPSLRDVAQEKDPEVFVARTPAEDIAYARLPGDVAPNWPSIPEDQIRAFSAGQRLRGLAESLCPCVEPSIPQGYPQFLRNGDVRLDKQRRLHPGRGLRKTFD